MKFSKNTSLLGLIMALALSLSLNNRAKAMTITANTTWSTSHSVSDLIITNNATLTITGSATTISVTGNIDVKPGSILNIENNAILKTGSSIVVESSSELTIPSAELYVNSATLTALGTSWNGIEVWGKVLLFTPEASRAKATFQDATVEKAERGVATYQVSSNQKKGGIVKASNTLFKDNWVSVSVKENPSLFLTSPNGALNWVPTNSYIRLENCQFLTTSNNPFYQQTTPINGYLYMVRVWDAKGVNILGCSFNDEAGTNASKLSIGINVFNSDIRVGPQFSNNWYPPFPYIQLPTPCTFNNLYVGIQASGPGSFDRILTQQCDMGNIGFGVILEDEQNAMLIYNHIHDIPNQGVGMTIRFGSSGYTVEGNTIEGESYDEFHGTNGIYISNCGPENNDIYRNTISDNLIGITANLNNRGMFGLEGLKLLCNDLTNNSIQNSWSVFIDGGIASFQGIPFAISNPNPTIHFRSAGNLFASLNLHDPQLVKSPNTPPFSYFYNPNIPSAYPGNNTNYPVIVGASNSCPVRQFPVIKPNIFVRNIQNVEAQISEVGEMKSASDSAKLAWLLDCHQSLIDSMLYTFMYGDSVQVRYDSMAWALEQVHYGYYNKVKLAGVYLMQLRYSDAINLLNQIPSEFNLSDDEITDVRNMADMYVVIDSLRHNGQSWDALASSMKQEVYSVANASGLYGQAVAIYLLERYENLMLLPQLPVLSRPGQPNGIKEQLSPGSKIYPNPTNGLVYINWESREKTYVKIYNSVGNFVLKSPLHSGLNSLNLRALPNGIYFIHVYEKGQSVYQQKIVKK